ncbi:MAG: hypothetical protein L3J52_09520, partial [Proteobacteria bacterium]|nr:hypothetical protein [Pseudomonadota bacterium]
INKKRKLMVEDLNGVINWQISNHVEKSYLQWYGLLLEGMPIRQSGIEFKFFDEILTIIGQPILPVFDGSIELKQLHLQNIFSAEIDAQVEMLINPISLQLITEKLGWPEMHGQISGSIPSMVKKGSVINFLGGLDIQVFDGHLEIKNLSLERLFGVAPVIASDIVFTGFDLEKLTETYGFGKITGKLSGTVEKLRITNWETDRLAANIYTVKDKSVKQLISQQALDHISSLGGIKGAVSKSFLRFFNDFRYKKIAFSCVLHDSVCRIGGINNTEDQFVLVEGGGLPRINIVGFTRNIDWSEFINRLLYAEYTD